ncbi:rod-binding protein [Primorskyibacter aestuariivivens]|uniref:rod-binding protein n=1 Tax=Primorskyibacter aestuariivivens TaxID=1888912 RepID=UPI0023006407|nr:rod-binding protein [Primorskyibacter aestuariivivens]MDA7430210.1 rod-binding protein [Primorskyibacter aestuariivivens]
MIPLVSNTPGQGGATQVPEEIRSAAQKLEAAFLAEMLKSAGLGSAPNSFGGGAGESQFSSFLIEAQAHAISRAGGLGLSEMFIKSLMETVHDGS